MIAMGQMLLRTISAGIALKNPFGIDEHIAQRHEIGDRL